MLLYKDHLENKRVILRNVKVHFDLVILDLLGMDKSETKSKFIKMNFGLINIKIIQFLGFVKVFDSNYGYGCKNFISLKVIVLYQFFVFYRKFIKSLN